MVFQHKECRRADGTAVHGAAAIGGLLRFDPQRRFDLPRAGAVIALIVLTLVYQHLEMQQLAESAVRGESAVAAVQREAAQLYANSGAGSIGDAAAASPCVRAETLDSN